MQDQVTQLILLGCLQYILFVIAITFHEAAHAWAAYLQGDYTAYYHGQVTLNPLPHLQREPIGTIVVPIITLFLNRGMGLMGWASAPYNPYWAARFPKKAFLMAMAGPAANLLLALVGIIAMRLMITFNAVEYFDTLESPFALLMEQPHFNLRIFAVLFLHTYLNLLLFVFNLIPFPPLDGAAIWQLVLKQRHYEIYLSYAHNPSFVILGIIAANGITRSLLPYIFVLMSFGVWGY